MRIGILGGTFDPIHQGHLIIAEVSRIRLGLERVLFVPAGRPWLKEGQPLSDARHRVRMVELATSTHPCFTVARNEVDRPGLSYTVDTLEELRSELPDDAELVFILGLDAFESFHRWKEPERVLELCRLVVVSRPGYSEEARDELMARYDGQCDRIRLLTVRNVDFSATEIRRRAAEGISFRYHTPDKVERYIFEHGLYRDLSTKGHGDARRNC